LIRKVLLLSAATLFAPAVAFAQAPPESTEGELSQVVVTASRAPTALTPYSAATIGPRRLSAADGVADALSDIADIYIQAPGGRSGFGSLFLRGSDPNFTTLLLDGVPLNNPTNTRGGSVNVSELSAAGIDRVEVVSEPLSGLYGSGALAGAVNMVVGGGSDDPGGRISLGLGSRGDYAGSAGLRGPITPNYGGAVTFEAVDDGDAAESSSFRAQTLTGKLAPLDRVDAGRIVFRFMKTEADTFPDNSGGPLFAARRTTESREGREGLIGVSQPVLVRDGFRLDLSASWLDRRDETVTPGVATSAFDPAGVPAGEDLTRYRRWIVQAVTRFELPDGWKAVAGLEGQDERARSAGFYDFGFFQAPSGFSGDRTTTSGFIEASRAGERLTINGGARIDDVEGIGTHTTGRLGARYDLGGGFALRGSLGTGFKAPSFYALGNPFVGNPNLKPEKSESGEVGIEWAGAGGRAYGSATAFHTRFKGLIDFIPGPVPALANRNVVISDGVSLVAGWRWNDRLSSRWSALYADTTDDETGETLLNRPKLRISNTLTWTPSDVVTVALRTTHVGKRDDYSTPTGARSLDAYTSVAVDAAWVFAPQTTARLIVDNALDTDYQSAIGFEGPGARARLALSRDF
jgi:outer membrane cobalamin receptor